MNLYKRKYFKNYVEAAVTVAETIAVAVAGKTIKL